MVSPASFSRAGRIYLGLVIASGTVVLMLSLVRLATHPIPRGWFVLAALTLLSGSATLQLPSSYASISISETFVFAAALLYGPSAATVTVSLDALAISFWIAKRHRDQPHRALFNMSAPAISAWVSANVFFRVSGIAPLSVAPASVNAILPPLFLFALVYFSLNSWLVTFIIALERDLSPLRVWTSSFLWLSLNYFGGASVAILFVGFTRTIDIGYLGIILPLLIVLYFTFRTTMGRVDDANKHLEQLNKLYMSTVETLAMAIDAKDQATHGHIRRVQLYAVRLAQEVGVRDSNLIKAVEAAALLHDMGKLAVPEYILNKPGKLTAGEFERMKLHASIGADILSAVEFPYPVVPIVRHHHENWDGSGYPDGLKGTEIPIGARILAVVDCFDALTSDRPYRPRLTDVEALGILMERRGAMYDPLIVDTFNRVHAEIAPGPLETNVPTRALETIGTARTTGAHQPTEPVLDQIASSADEMLTLYELARSLAGQVSVRDSGDIIANHLRRLVPSSLCVFYIWDPRTNEVEASHAVGEGAETIKGLRITLGQRLSGWVAAHRQTIVNSDPTLDFGELNRSRPTPLRSCISAPLVADEDELVGVLTMYSGDSGAFNDDHKRIIESVAKQIAHTLRRAVEFDAAPRRDQITGLPSTKQLETVVSSSLNGPTTPFAVILVDVGNLKMVNRVHGRAAGDEAMRHVVHHTQHSLRVADMLFRDVSDDLVAFLHTTDLETAYLVARRIESAVALHPLRLPEGAGVLSIQVSVGVAAAPRDGATFASLLAAARRDAHRPESDNTDLSVH